MLLKELCKVAFFADYESKFKPSKDEQHKAHLIVKFELVMVNDEPCLNIAVEKNRYPVKIVTEGL